MADPICTFLFSIFVLCTTFTIMRDILIVLMEGEALSLALNIWYSFQSCIVILLIISYISTPAFSLFDPWLRYSSRGEIQWGAGWSASSEGGDSGAQPSHLGAHHEPGCTDCTRGHRWEETVMLRCNIFSCETMSCLHDSTYFCHLSPYIMNESKHCRWAYQCKHT